MAEHLVGDPHGLFFHNRGLAVLLHDFAPPVDLLMYVDLDRTHIGAAAIQGRGERKLAVLSNLKGRHHNDADWPHISGAVTQATTSAVHRTSIHACRAANAFQGMPEPLHSQTRRSSVVDQDDVHGRSFARSAERRSVLGYPLARGASGEQPNEDRKALCGRNEFFDPDRAYV